MNAGDIVVLKSGGPDMTILNSTRSAGKYAIHKCYWVNRDGERQEAEFDERVLRRGE